VLRWPDLHGRSLRRHHHQVDRPRPVS
jgi:hypothetical protein